MVTKFQWKPFWLATQPAPQNDWTATQNGVNYDLFAQAPLDAQWIDLCIDVFIVAIGRVVAEILPFQSETIAKVGVFQ